MAKADYRFRFPWGSKAERLEMERFVDALRLWMGKRPLYKLDRNEGCLDWFHRPLGDGNHHHRARPGGQSGSFVR